MTVAYIFSRYPLLSETFILREMWQLERQGHRLLICPLRRVPGRHHVRVEQMRAPVFWAPWFPWRAHAYWLRRRPRVYLATLAETLWRNRGDARLWLGALVYWGKAVAIARHVQAQGVTHVHAHYITHPALTAYVVRRLTGIPYTCTVHAHDIFCHRAMLPEKLRAAQAVVAISEFNRAWLERAVGLPRSPIPVVHCGIEWANYASLASERGSLRSAPRDAGPPGTRALRLLTVGSLQAYKGHRYLIDACARLRTSGVVFVCRIVGGGRLYPRLQRQILRLQLGACVNLDGAAVESEVMAALAWADVFVLPSICMPNGKTEGVPVALMEAMASGLPVVASRLSGIPELVVHNRNGLLVPAGDAAALAAAIARLQDPDLRRRLGENGSADVHAGFDLATNAARLAQVWAEVAPISAEVAA
ncbi:MAG: glycosyltransferase family 4 protein [Terriglobales bacterium]